MVKVPREALEGEETFETEATSPFLLSLLVELKMDLHFLSLMLPLLPVVLLLGRPPYFSHLIMLLYGSLLVLPSIQIFGKLMGWDLL